MKRKEYIQSLDTKEFAKFLENFSVKDVVDWWCTEGRCPHKLRTEYLGQKDCSIDLEENGCPYEHDNDIIEIWLEEEIIKEGKLT